MLSEPVASRDVHHWSPITSDAERSSTGPIILLTLVFKAKRRNWVGKCVELGTATAAGSLEATLRELIELVALHLNAVEVSGQRERYFAQKGIRVRQKLPSDVGLP